MDIWSPVKCSGTIFVDFIYFVKWSHNLISSFMFMQIVYGSVKNVLFLI